MTWEPEKGVPRSTPSLLYWTRRQLTALFAAAGGGSPITDHATLTNVTEDQHHPKLHDIESHSDVAITSLLDRHMLRWDTATGKWVNEAGGGIFHDDLTNVTEDQHHPKLHVLNSHTDVVTSSHKNGQALMWDSPTGKWINADVNYFKDKEHDDPILLVFTGQSNAVGQQTIGSVPNSSNSRVFSWNSDGLAGGQARAFGWAVPDLAAAELLDYSGGAIYSGINQGDIGHIGWACADYIQRKTGRDVYIVCVAFAGQAISTWLPAGSMEVVLDGRVKDALASTEMSGITQVDAILWMQGESDSGRLAEDYIADWETVRGGFETEGWAGRHYTQWLLGETTTYGFVWKDVYRTLAKLDSSQDEMVRLIRGTSLSYSDVGIWGHYDGDSLMRMGASMARSLLAGPIPKTQNRGEEIIINATADYTVTGMYNHEIVICDSASLITVTLSALNLNDRVTVIRAGTGAVTVDGAAAELIRGVATYSIPARYDNVELVAAVSEWV